MDPHEHIRPIVRSHARRRKIIGAVVGVGLLGAWFLGLMESAPDPQSPPASLDSLLRPDTLVPVPLPADDTPVRPGRSAVSLPIAPSTIDSAVRAGSAPPDAEETPLASITATGGGRYLIPVAGITSDKLQDTYKDARSDGRVHDAIDIMAPRGTPVVATNDGEIVMLHQSERGGITLYQRCPTGDTIYYYAHLDRYADGVVKGKMARRGNLLGYVGETGNVAPGNPHLHFAIWLVIDPKKIWDGENLNPYPLLR